MKFVRGKNLKLVGKKSIFIDQDVIIGNNVTIFENNRIEKGTIIGDNVTLLPNNHIIASVIKDNVIIESSHIAESIIHSNVNVGPFARLRPNSEIFENAKIGNFVEIKNSKIGEGTKVSHLAYVGDADIGKNCNIGCGAIFVNYNGKTKNRTIVGDDCFIGSNCNIIAPVEIRKGSYICAGTTNTINTNEYDFVIGRSRETVKPERAKNYMKQKENK
ncbi:MAG: hypothetical protein J6J23_01575 [Clostridia bacterium]|nr:hypothetical protein [Clostridia bacterium]